MRKPTRRQHTVWRKYLRAWASDDKIWCAMADKRFPADLMKVGQERDFYRIREMTDEDIAFVHATFIAPMNNPNLQKLVEQWIVHFDRVRALRQSFEEIGVDARSALEPLYIELEEKLHGAIEQHAIPLLDRLLVSEAFCLVDEGDYGDFMHFMMTQYFRTSRMFGNLRRSMGDRFLGTLERSMGVLRHIMATASGWTLVNERDTMKPYLLTNDTEVPLIAGDQPVINMLAVELPADVAVEDCEFYYPLSPHKALVVTRSDRFSTGRISDAGMACEFNRLIALSAERQIYAAKMSDLKDVMGLVGRHVAQH